MRVRNEALTLAQSIDSCIDALDELIITYHECTDESVQIIENKKLQYPDKIMVIPYPYHVIGVGASDEEYEYGKTLPIGHPQLLATYYNNALQYVNYKYVMKMDADQVYFSKELKALRDSIVNGVKQNKLARLCGKMVNVFCQKRGNKRIWSKWHLVHWLQYIVVPLFQKQYKEYCISGLLKGNGYLSLSGVNVFRFNNSWYSPLGSMGGPYMGLGDHLVFEADEETEWVPWEYTTDSGGKALIERFDFPTEKVVFLFGFYWFHLKPMKKASYERCLSYFREHPDSMFPINQLGKASFDFLLKNVETYKTYVLRRDYYNFVHNLDRKKIKVHSKMLQELNGWAKKEIDSRIINV